MTLSAKLFEELKPYLIYDKKLSASKHNIQVYNSRFNIMCRYFGEREFNRANFTAFIGYLKEKGYSNNYINNFIKLAKHVDRFYKLNEILDYSYFEKPRGVVDYLTPQQIEKMIDVRIDYRTGSEWKNKRNQALLSTLFLTGARVSEMLNLRWDDLKGGASPYAVLNQTKTNELRYAPLPQTLYALLVNLPHFGGFVFSNELGHQIDPESVSNDIKRRAVAIGITRRVYSHLIRHSFVNFMLRNGAPIELVSRLAGHKRIETTNQYYIHVMLDELSMALHAHHPYFKKQQTLDFLLEKFQDMMSKVIDAERYVVQGKRHEKKISLEVKEIHD